MLFTTLTIQETSVLSFSLGETLFSRIGTGLLTWSAREVCFGTVTPELFQRVVAGLNVEVLRWKGIHSMPGQKGKRCELFMAVLFKGGQEWTTQWHYGSASEGPPPELVAFLRRAIVLTEQQTDRVVLPGEGEHRPACGAWGTADRTVASSAA